MHVHLIVPDLFGPRLSPAATDPPAPLGRRSLPAIETLIARGRRRTVAAGTIDDWLLREFGVTGEQAGAAPFAAAGDGLAADACTWMSADPVHLRIDRDSLALIDRTHFSLGSSDATALCAALNTHFATDGFTFHAPDPSRWYLRIEGTTTARMTTLEDARGHAIDGHLPGGPDGMRWQAVMNEAQMLLHTHPVNEARPMPINSIWLSGAGRRQSPQAPNVRRIVADTPLLRGLARATGLPIQPLPADANGLLAAPPQSGVCWVLLDALRAPVAYGDIAAWRDGLAMMERQWFAPVLAALRRRRIGMVTIQAWHREGTLIAETTASDLRYVWRRRRPLDAYVDRGAVTAGIR